MFAFTTLAILFAMLLTLIRALLGPTLYDRILAINTFGTITVLFIAVFGFMSDRADFLDVVLVYALINFIATIAVLKFFEYGDLGISSSGKRPDDESPV